MSTLAPEANLDNVCFVLDQEADGLPAQIPHLRELTDAIVSL
jgi:hypothetical protein